MKKLTLIHPIVLEATNKRGAKSYQLYGMCGKKLLSLSFPQLI